MATTREDIARWLERGKQEGATHVIIVCDTFDHGDYPVFVKDGAEAARKKHREYIDGKHKMQRVMEVYNLSGDIEAQLSARRAFEFEAHEPRLDSSCDVRSLPNDIRNAGWVVAVHNDYRIHGALHTFWLFTKGDRFVKGEGRTDAEALDQIRAAAFGGAPPTADATPLVSVGSVGMTFAVTCEACGQPQSIVIPWEELAPIANGQVPPGWLYWPREGELRPDLACHRCDNTRILTMTPAEASRHLKAGAQAGFVVTESRPRATRKQKKPHNRTTRRGGKKRK